MPASLPAFFPARGSVEDTRMNRDAVDPVLVPQRTLYTGARMPAIGLGTFGSDHISADDMAAAGKGAIQVGYRHLDCASVSRQ